MGRSWTGWDRVGMGMGGIGLGMGRTLVWFEIGRKGFGRGGTEVFFSFIFLWVFVYMYLCRPSEASTRYCAIPGGYPPQD